MNTAIEPVQPSHRPTEAPTSSSPFSRLPITVTPQSSLFTYYVLTSLLLGPLFLFALVPFYFRYHTMRYEVDEEGITMRWGILFRREISLTYARIQDIHLSSNFVERWLGLAKVQVQTASGSASAEMIIEGLPATESVRDFLYAKMRGARGHAQPTGGSHEAPIPPDALVELTDTLRLIADEVRALHRTLAPGDPEARDV